MKGSEIKAIRESLHLTQEGMARRIGVAFATLNKWENEKTVPSPLALQRLKELGEEAGVEISIPEPRLRLNLKAKREKK